MNNYLYRSGVKGMKWGVRKDSKRTASLRQQYRSEKSIYKKELLKAKYQDSKIRDRIDQNGLSKRQEKLKNKYMAKGMSKQNAEIAAVKRTDFEKKLLIGAALGASVAAAYAYRNHLRYTTGDTLDENSLIGRIATYSGNEKISGFYVYTNKKDSKKYNTLLVGEHMLRGSMGGDMLDVDLFRKSFKPTNKLKIASPNEFNKIAYEQYKKDKDKLKQTAEKMISDSEKQSSYTKYMNNAYRRAGVSLIKSFSVFAVPSLIIGTAKENKRVNELASNYYRRTNDSSKGLNEAAKLEDKYQIDKLTNRYNPY